MNQRSCDGMLKVYRDAGMSKERLDRLIGRMHLTEQPWKNEKNEKIIYYGAPFPVAKVHADMEPYFDAVAISLDGMGDFAGEIGINGINKATGMERYLNHVGISRENCIAIGDGPNDLQMMEYAGWYKGRKVDISIAEQYYADHGVPMMKTTQRFYRKYFGLCCEWYLAQKKLNWAADFEFALFPYLVNGIKNHLEEAYFRDMSGCELAEIEQAAGQKCQPIGHIGYYYPAEVWISEYGKLYAKYEYQDEIECFPDVFALIERELRQCKFDSAAMKTVGALDGKP